MQSLTKGKRGRGNLPKLRGVDRSRAFIVILVWVVLHMVKDNLSRMVIDNLLSMVKVICGSVMDLKIWVIDVKSFSERRWAIGGLCGLFLM